MTRSTLTLIALAGLVLVIGQPALAQTTGRLTGEVRDPNGAAISGVIVTISSGALMGGSRTVMSGETGGFRFTALPPGSYDVVAELAGFQTVTLDGVRVGINANATTTVVMYAEFAEIVTVPGEALVDVKASAVGSSYSAEFKEDLPLQRHFTALMKVSPGMSEDLTGGFDRTIAYGGNMQSNTWHIDGLEASAPETGSSWIYTHPDVIEEIQVLGIGAPAEYGNMMGAAFNVVTKTGSNELRGRFHTYWQDDTLTDSRDDYLVEESEFREWKRQELWDVSATLGGPITKDKLWFFAAYWYLRDNFAPPGADPDLVRTKRSDLYDLKLSAQFNRSNRLDVKGSFAEWRNPEAYANADTDATPTGQGGENRMWALNFQSIFSDRTFMEVRYSGWDAWDDYLSSTGATDPYIDYSPPGGGPPQYSGGIVFPWIYETGTQQGDVTVSHYADDFLNGEHDFKFGVRYGDGTAELLGLGDGHYTFRYEYSPGYPYYYLIEYQQYYLGNDQEALSAFVDDSWSVNDDSLTLNLGLRYDRLTASIPAFPELDGDSSPTGARKPGIDPVFTWNNVSPRLGFAYAAGENRATVIRGSFGVYYDGNVSGNWSTPPPDPPDWIWSWSHSRHGPWYEGGLWWRAQTVDVDPDLQAPRTLQYALGFERAFAGKYSFGAMVVYKDTTDLIGLENMGDGIYEEVLFTDPFTGTQYTLLDEIEPATIRRGNRPGFTAAGYFDEYWQEYKALVLTFDRRFSDWWGMMSSYTWSESTGLIPTMLSQRQFNPPYDSPVGRDPNNFINADGQNLQGDRTHMLRLQANFELPWEMHAHTAMNYQTGKPYSRQIRVFGLGQGRSTVIMEPASDDQRHPDQLILDIAVGKRFDTPGKGKLKLDLQLFNLLNEDASDSFQTLILQEGDQFLPNWWVYPRRLMLRLGFEF